MNGLIQQRNNVDTSSPNAHNGYFNNNNNSMFNGNPTYINPSSMSSGNGNAGMGMGMGINGNGAGQGSYQMPGNGNPNPYQQQQGFNNQWQQGGGSGGMNYSMDPSSSSSSQPTSNQAYFNPAQLSSNGSQTFGNYNAQNLNPFGNQQVNLSNVGSGNGNGGGPPPSSSSSNPNGSIDPSTLFRMQQQQNQGFQNGGGGSGNGMIGGGIGGGTMNPNSPFAPPPQKQSQGWDPNGGMTGNGGQYGNPSQFQQQQQQQQQQRFQNPQHFQPQSGNSSMSPMMNQSPRPGSQPSYQQPHQRRPSEAANTSSPMAGLDNRGKREDQPTRTQQGSGAVPSQARPSAVAMPGISDIQEVYLANAKAQAGTQIKALQSAKPGLNATDTAMSVGLIPIPNCQGAFWIPVISTKDQQSHLSNASAQAKLAAQSPDPSVKQTASPANMLQSRGLVYVPVTSLPPGVKPSISRPDNPTHGGTVMSLGDARMLGLGPFQGKMNEQIHQIQLVSGLVRSYQSQAAQQKFQQQQQQHHQQQQMPHGSPPSQAFPSPHQVQSQGHGFSSPAPGTMLPPQSPAIPFHQQQQQLDRKPLGSNPLHMNAMSAAVAAGGGAPPLTSNQPLPPAAQSIQPPPAIAPSSANPSSSISPSTANLYNPSMFAAIGTSAIAASKDKLPLPGLEDGGDESSRSKLDNQNRASIQSLQKSNATGSNFGLKLFNNRLKKKSDSDPSSSTKKEKEEEAGTDLLGDGLGPNLFAQGILPPEVGFNPDQALVSNRTQLVTSVSTFNVQEANKLATSIANHPPKDEDGNDLTPVRGGLLPSQSNAGNRITAHNTSRRVLPTDNRNSKEEAAWKEMSETESKELERIIKKDVEYQKIVEDQFDKTNGFLKGKARELWPVDRSWEDIVRNNKGKARVEERVNEMDVDSKPPPKKKSRLHWWEKNEFEDLFNPHHSRSSDNFESFRIIFPSEKRKNGIQELNNSIKEGNGPISNRALGVLNLSTNPVTMSSSFSTLLVDKEKELEHLKERERLREKEKERERERESKENGSNTIVEISNVNYDYNSKEQVKDEREEDLIPIRLELDIDGWRLRDTFTWSTSNCTDPTKFNKEHEDSTTIKPEIFAQSLCDELGFPSNVFIGPIKEAIRSQISEHLATRALIPSHLGWEEEDSSNRGLHSGRGKLEGGDLKWWKNWRDEMDRKNQILEKVDNETGDFLMEVEEDWSGNVKKRKRIDEKDTKADVIEIEDDEVILLGTDGAPKKLNVEDLRILVKLDITVGAMNLVDQFEWDLSDPRNCAEDFAETFASDLGLAGEFKTAIAHSIREQAAVHFASLAIVGYPFDGSAVQDEELRSAFLPTISSDSRLTRSKNEAESFTPRLVELTESEIDKLDKERERELRRKKRQTRGRRAINLPDREPLKSSRTSAVWGLQNGNLEGSTGISGVGGDLRVSTRRAAAAAIDKINAATVADRGGSPGPDGIYTFNSTSVSAPASGGNNTPTPAPPVKQPKKPRYQNYAASFTYPGGLGTTQEDLGPRFTSGPVADEKKEPAAVATATVAQVVVPTSGSAAQASGAPVLGLSRAERAQRDLDLQHPNLHDGQWHCSNCGIPASLVPSTRKGPLGPNTLCAVCGKYYHRFRRMRETTYSRDIAFHKKNYNKTSSDADVNGVGRVASQNSNAGPSVPTQNQSTVKGGKNTTVDPDPDYEEDESMDTRGQSPDLPFLQVGSPEDSASSRSNSPVSNRSASPVKRSIKLVSKSPASQPVSLPQVQQASTSASSPQPASKAPLPNGPVVPANAASPPPPPPVNPPQWLTDAADTLRRNYPKDKFDFAVRKYPAGTPAPSVPEWRIKCLDCPGKLYTPGPAETLDNFTLHLKNRKHRQAVQDRLNGVTSTASPSAAANSPKTANQSIASTSNAK